MKTTLRSSLLALAAAALCSGAAYAQSDGAGTVQRDVNQQQRIQQGLQSGALSTREAARLERGETRIERAQSRALADGKLSSQERARLAREQDAESRAIAAAKHNAVTGDPQSASSKRMQADVQRNVDQQQRIEAGVQSGALTGREAAGLERGQSHVTRKEARAGADGQVGAGEQARIQRGENHQSRRIWRQKHDAQRAG